MQRVWEGFQLKVVRDSASAALRQAGHRLSQTEDLHENSTLPRLQQGRRERIRAILAAGLRFTVLNNTVVCCVTELT